MVSPVRMVLPSQGEEPVCLGSQGFTYSGHLRQQREGWELLPSL
jgi:hypothetical protein